MFAPSRRIPVLLAVLALLAVLIAPSAKAADGATTTGFPLGQFGAASVVVDDAHSRVLVAGSTANAVDVFDFSGKLLQVIGGEAGASGLAIDGSTAYVSDRTTGVIDQINLVTLSSAGPLASGLTNPAEMAFAGGRLWVSTATGLAGVDPSSGTVSLFPYPGFALSLLSSSGGAPDDLFAADAGVIPGTVDRFDVSSGSPVLMAQTHGAFLGNISDIAVSADGTRLLVTGSGVTEFATSTMAFDGMAYGPPQFSSALATSPGDGGIMAEGLETSPGTPDLVVNPLGQNGPLLTTEVTDSNIDWIAPHTLALSSDGSYLFTVNPVAFFGTGQTFYAIHFTAPPDTDLAISTPDDVTTPATSPAGTTVTYPLPAVSDPDDTITATAVCSPASGTVFPIGSTTVTCSVTDADDTPPTTTTTFAVTVEGAGAQLSDLAGKVVGVGAGTSLEDKVGLAQSSLASGDIGGTCSVLTALVHGINAQAGKTILAGQAAQLIASAQRIRAVLAC
jgi:hypothetical protein